LRHGVYYICTC